ncbi:hypothetical protein KR018_010469 [Drosophila ironensis]|nr:hypothetical protein KR018_010469 [Drosophila ironensis]
MKNSKKKPRKSESKSSQADAVQQKTIKLLHEYNDLKDATQIVLGALATLKNVAVGSLYAAYNLPIDN